MRLTHSALQSSLRRDFYLRTARSKSRGQPLWQNAARTRRGQPGCSPSPAAVASSSVPRQLGFLSHMPCNELTLPQAQKHRADVKQPPGLPPQALILLAVRRWQPRGYHGDPPQPSLAPRERGRGGSASQVPFALSKGHGKGNVPEAVIDNKPGLLGQRHGRAASPLPAAPGLGAAGRSGLIEGWHSSAPCPPSPAVPFSNSM